MNNKILILLLSLLCSGTVIAEKIAVLSSAHKDIVQYEYGENTTFDDLIKHYYPNDYAHYIVNACVLRDENDLFSWYAWEDAARIVKIVNFLTYQKEKVSFKILLRIIPNNNACCSPCLDCWERYNLCAWRLGCRDCYHETRTLKYLHSKEAPVYKLLNSPTSPKWPTATRDDDKKPINLIEAHAKAN